MSRSRRPRMWARQSCELIPSLCLAAALLLAASFAPGDMWFSRDKRQLLWALMMDTERRRRSWLRIRPRSLSEIGRPSTWEMWDALEATRRLRSSWKSWETSPYWPATRHKSSPKPLRRSSSGPTWFGSVWQYFLSIFCALSRYSLGRRLARWSTAFWWELYQVTPALMHFNSASW